jgi:hypothetical protein
MGKLESISKFLNIGNWLIAFIPRLRGRRGRRKKKRKRMKYTSFPIELQWTLE